MKKIILALMSTIIVSASILTGCGDKDLSINRLMDDLKSGNITDARSLIVNPDMSSIFGTGNADIVKSDLGKEYYKNISFTISNIDMKDDTASADVNFKYPDMGILINKAVDEVSDGKDIKDVKDFNSKVIFKIIDYLKSGSFDKKESDIKLRFEKGIDQWLIKDTKELNTVIYDELDLVKAALG